MNRDIFKGGEVFCSFHHTLVQRFTSICCRWIVANLFLVFGCGFDWNYGLAETDILALKVVQKSQDHYRSINSLEANFTQVFTSHMIREEEHGVLMIKKPQKMYWEYKAPLKKYLFKNGKRAFFYIPHDHQVHIYNMQDNQMGLFFTGQAQLDKNFEIIFETEELPLEKKHFLVRLTPRQTNGLLLRILLEIVPSSYKIVRLVSIEPIGNRNEYILRDVRENVRISDKRFHFKVPKGVEIIRDQRK